MSDIIKLLPDAISSQIAAGEVIQRPASAVKELMENSIDAESTAIKLVIRNAGKALIQVSDDGCGMSATDARMCFEKHATSKINNIEDLFSIRTMGFRGEAMAAIAAIAQVSLRTRRAADEIGTCIDIEGSEVISQEFCSCTAGTTIAVKNLFYNTPARRNFLKSNPVETKHIFEEFQRLALSYPETSFYLHNEDTEVFHLKPGNLRKRIVGVFGDNYNERLVPVEEATDIIQIRGFIGKPEYAKKTRGEQYIFVNNRFIKSNYLNHAIYKAYSEIIAKDSYPFFVLFIDIDPKYIDINVHPTKQEIKFEDDRLVYAMVNAGIKHALAQFSITPTLDFDQETGFSHLASFSKTNFDGSQSGSAAGSGFRFSNDPGAGIQQRTNLRNWRDLYNEGEGTEERSITIPSKLSENELFEDAGNLPTQFKPFQLHQKFIVTQIASGFILIDQQSAHERILYEQYLAYINESGGTSQRLLFPQTVQLNAQDAEVLKEILPELGKLGFDVQEFGMTDFVVHALPSEIAAENESKILDVFLEEYKQNLQLTKFDKRESLARSLARSSAIKHGKILGQKEMQVLIDQLFACQNPYTAPNGRFNFVRFDLNELEKKFESSR